MHWFRNQSSFHPEASLWPCYHLHPASRTENGGRILILQKAPSRRGKHHVYSSGNWLWCRYYGGRKELTLQAGGSGLCHHHLNSRPLIFVVLFEQWQIQVFTTFWVKIRSDLMAMNTFSYYFLLTIAPQVCSMIISLWKVFSHCVPQSKKRKRKHWGKHTQNTIYSQIIHMISSSDSLSVIRTKS